MTEMTQKVLEIWSSGGWVMIPLFLLAVLLYAQAFAIVLFLRRARLDGTKAVHWRQWVRDPSQAEEGAREVIAYTQDGVETSEQVRNRFDEIRGRILSAVDRRRLFVSMLVAAAPLLGLLGTVLGMLQTFFGISTSGGTETAGVVAAGISEALVTTQTGLMIALPGLFLVMYIQRQRHILDANLTRLESLTMSRFAIAEVAADPSEVGVKEKEGRWHDAA